MEKVFSRWPSQTRPETLPGANGVDAVLPPWMATGYQHSRQKTPISLLASIAVGLVPFGLAFTAGVWFAGADLPLRMLLAGVSVLAAAATLAFVVHLRLSLLASQAQYQAVFERAGISTWREDWSEVAREVAALRQHGISDMETYFATRPDELRALCAKVMIKDVNAFTVEEAGAPDKAAFIGPLDRLIPATDQTFVQWLVAFSRGERFFRSEAHITLPDGSVRDTLFAAALPDDLDGFSNIIVTSLDITGYKSEQAKLHAADAEIARASRISTVGALSASIAHEVNSPLAAVLANAQAALRWLRRPTPDIAEATEAVAAIVAEAARAKDVVARTRAFVGNATASTAPFDIVAAARDANLLVERDLRRLGATVHLQAPPGLPPVKGDLVQVQQVFTNLLMNAAQAMGPQAKARDITVSFKTDRDSVRVDVADTGPGIDPQQLERVFEPFYTTKSDGMGMGLAICRNCIDAQGGNIWATRANDGGAIIHFTLPIHNG